MRGLSEHIEPALDTIIKGLEREIIIDFLDDSKMKATMDSKVDSFDSAKKLLHRWANSPNAPAKDKTRMYVQRLIDAGETAMNYLEQGLSKDIDYDKLKADKYAAAVKAKPLILDAIYTLESSVNEFRLQLETDEINFGEKEFKIGYPEKFAKGEFFNKKDYHKEWLDKDNDAVIICPKSTKGEIIEISELRIWLPEVPENETEILFHDLPKDEQYWRRQEEPKGLSPDNVDMYHDYIMEEFRRRREGIWFMNYGKPTYLTGNMYWALQWCKMLDDGDFMKFRIAQLEMFYHLEACIVDKRCLGEIFLKSRRTGFTYIILAILLNMATSTRNGKYGMTSKSGDDVEEAFAKFSYMFLNLPFYFRPVVKGKEDSLVMLEFGKPSNMSKDAKKKRDTNTDDYLNTVVDHRPTKNGSYDSIKLNGILGDECVLKGTKILDKDFQPINVEDVKVGMKIRNGNGGLSKVMRVTNGVDDMYEVSNRYGINFQVNSNHKLLIELRNCGRKKEKQILSLTPEEYLNLSKDKQRRAHLLRYTPNDFKLKELPIDPYILGAWLGDGTSKDSKFVINTEKDPEILEELEKYSVKEGLELVVSGVEANCVKYRLKNKGSKGGGKNSFLQKIRALGIFGEKRIPKSYLFSSQEQRMEMLAGLIDTDGHLQNKTAQIKMSRLGLMTDIYQLCKLSGIGVSEIKTSKTKFNTYCHQITMSVPNEVRMRVKRKQQINKTVDCCRSNFKLKKVNKGEYYGFTLDKINTFLLADYTIQNNCGKWSRPADYVTHLGQIRPTLMPNSTVVGTAFLGSTMGAMSQGGSQFKELIEGSRIKDRNPITGKTPTALYFHFLPAQNNMEQFTDKYGVCWTEKPPKGTLNVNGEPIEMGSVDYLIAVEDSQKQVGDKALNEQYRTYPRTVEHAMRDEASETVFNITKIYTQLDHNETVGKQKLYTIGNFRWKDGIQDSDVEWCPNPKGRFKLAWIPSVSDDTAGLLNAVKEMNGKYYPLNKGVGALGCDPFTLKSTHGKGSKGAIHGKTMHAPDGGAPSNKFFLEYISRPADETIFFEDAIMACRFYGMPILVESNRIDLLRHFRNRGYRGFALNRVDRNQKDLNPNEIEYGGQMMSGKDMLDSHMNSIGSWIEDYVGESTKEEIRPLHEMGDMPFEETLKDWLGFNPDNRTDYDATISSGLCIMACSRMKYSRKAKKSETKRTVNFLQQYNNSGEFSSPISESKYGN